MCKSISSFLLVFVSLVLFCKAGFAQDEKEKFVGFKGGISIPKLSGGSDNELSRDYKSRLAPNFGGFVEFGIAKKTSFQLEINYAGHGGKRVGIQPVPRPITGLPSLPAGNYYYADFKNVAKLNYLEFPVLVKYKFGSKGKTRIYAGGGAFYGYLLNAKSVTSGSSTLYLDRDGTIPVLIPPANTPFPAIPLDANTNIKDEINRNNFGITGDGGIEIPHRKNYFLIDARVSYGLRAIQKDTVANGNNKTGSLVISIGYAFGFK